ATRPTDDPERSPALPARSGTRTAPDRRPRRRRRPPAQTPATTASPPQLHTTGTTHTTLSRARERRHTDGSDAQIALDPISQPFDTATRAVCPSVLGRDLDKTVGARRQSPAPPPRLCFTTGARSGLRSRRS